MPLCLHGKTTYLTCVFRDLQCSAPVNAKPTSDASSSKNGSRRSPCCGLHRSKSAWDHIVHLTVTETSHLPRKLFRTRNTLRIPTGPVNGEDVETRGILSQVSSESNGRHMHTEGYNTFRTQMIGLLVLYSELIASSTGIALLDLD